MRKLICFSLCSMLAACAAKNAESGSSANASKSAAIDEAAIEKAMAASTRTEDEKKRDAARHPKETLAFFGVRPDATVVELWPGGGWYTAILAPLVADKGKLIVTNYDPAGPPDTYPTKAGKRLAERLSKDAASFGKVEVRVVHPPTDINLGPDNSADVVLTFRNIHNWMEDNYADKVLAAAFKVLKPGGILGLEEHRAKEGTSAAESVKTGYVPEETVVKAAEAVGFKLAGKSEVNANPKDTKDHPEGVWTLPPTLALKDKDRARYDAIGESDRMTLRFVKPVAQ